MEPAHSPYRCINAACGRAFARQVNFCPWCGAAQQPAAAAVAPPAPPASAPSRPQVEVRPAPPAMPAPPPPAPPSSPPRPTPPPPPVRPAPPSHTAPPVRKPVRLRWWLLALGALWLAWMLTKPLEARIERRMAAAIALAKECKPRQAQDELIALRKTRASREQLRKVQVALDAAARACTRAERRRTETRTPTQRSDDRPRERPLADPTRNE